MKKKLLSSVLAAGLLIPTSFASAAWQDDVVAKVGNSEKEISKAINYWQTQPKQDRDLVLPLLNQKLLNVKSTQASADLAKAIANLESLTKEINQMKEARQKAAENSYNYGKEKKVKEAELAKINEKLNGANASAWKVAKYNDTEFTYPQRAEQLRKEILALENTVKVADSYSKYDRAKEKELRARAEKLRVYIRKLRAEGVVATPTTSVATSTTNKSEAVKVENTSAKTDKSEVENTLGTTNKSEVVTVGSISTAMKNSSKLSNKLVNKTAKKVLPKTSAVK